MLCKKQISGGIKIYFEGPEYIRKETNICGGSKIISYGKN